MISQSGSYTENHLTSELRRQASEVSRSKDVHCQA